MPSSRLLNVLPAALLLAFATTGIAEERVTISTGEVVILKDDGTWNYEVRPVQREKVIKTDRSGFVPSQNCYPPYGQGYGGYNVWIDADRWRHGKRPHVKPPNRPVVPAQ